MKPPYQVTSKILKLISEISMRLGEVNANYLNKQSPQLRKNNRIKTIHSSLQIEGNTLSLDQVSALIENKRVVGPQKDVKEVLNAISAYDQLTSFDSTNEKSFLKAHKLLMDGLITNSGQYRKSEVGIMKGNNLTHLAPPAENIKFLMKELFSYLKNSDDPVLIKSSVFHYETEFIHPFTDGNGRMGRMWQTVILMKDFPVFEYLPFETLISKKQKEYYAALSKSDKEGNSTIFIEFMLQTLNESLENLLQYNNRIMSDIDRIEYFLSHSKKEFTRKDYMNIFKDISSASASRDLKKALEIKLITKSGTKNTTKYKIN
ncbi:MAG: Fic family protein [Chitinophagaceae bacterium]|nr:Fic family protein [Chitinophagaceae bacterium]